MGLDPNSFLAGFVGLLVVLGVAGGLVWWVAQAIFSRDIAAGETEIERLRAELAASESARAADNAAADLASKGAQADTREDRRVGAALADSDAVSRRAGLLELLPSEADSSAAPGSPGESGGAGDA